MHVHDTVLKLSGNDTHTCMVNVAMFFVEEVR